MSASFWVFGLLFAVWLTMKQLFRKRMLPFPIARAWGRFHFKIWKLFLEVSYYFGHRTEPWSDVIENRVWLGKSVLSRHVPKLKKMGITRVLNMQDEYEGRRFEICVGSVNKFQGLLRLTNGTVLSSATFRSWIILSQVWSNCMMQWIFCSGR